MKCKQKQGVKISDSSEGEPTLRAQLTAKGLTLHGQGSSAIRAVVVIACLAIIAMAVVAVIAFFTKFHQAGSQESAQQTIYSSRPFFERPLEEIEVDAFPDDGFIAP